MEALPTEALQGVLFYVLCSGFMLIANKIVITLIPFPAFVFCVQLASAVVFIFVFRALSLLQVDKFTRGRVMGFAPYIVLFVISVYCNGRALAASNAETVIVFRAASPLFVSVLDFFFLGRDLPSRRSLFALGGVVAGSVGYMLTDSEFHLNGMQAYFWVSVYTVAIVLEMTYGKVLLSKVKFDTPVWGSVLFTNLLALPPMIGVAMVSGEVGSMSTMPMRVGASEIAALLVSCAIGIGIGWAGWNCRSMISATSFTLVGVVCKLITVIVNVLIWNKHASAFGIAWLLVCLAASSLYRQAPLRDALQGELTPPKSTQETKLGNMWESGKEDTGASSGEEGA